MTDFAVANSEPGTCQKCKGAGVYRWGPNVNGRCTKEGTCWSCQGTGRQDTTQIRRNTVYNRYKLAELF